jgi:hypothetical protein
MGLRIALLATLAAAAALATSGSALASAPDVGACAREGWQTVGGSDQRLFKNVGECVSYNARGGTLVPLLQAIADERCIIEPIDPPNSACFTVTGFGLEPGSVVSVTLVIEGEPIFFFPVVDAEGEVFFQTAAGCIPGTEEIVLSISAFGVTASGVAVTTPTDTFSTFCTRT